ncbi:MAG: alpha/beta hydrolase family protein, partial [Promethearchaeota archaeon]
LIGQGANDPRVNQIESDQIVEKLKKRGINVEYLIYLDEGHGLEKQKNYHDFNKKAIEFIYRSFFKSEIDLHMDEF